MAHIRKRKHPDGRDRYQACFVDQFGRRHAFLVGTRKRETLNHAGRIMAEARESAYGIGDIGFRAFAETFLRVKENGLEQKRNGLARPRNRKGG